MAVGTTEITNSEDLIDSRDVIARIEYLEECDSFVNGVITEEGHELALLKNLAEQGENSAADWLYGEVLVRDSYFVEYAQQLAEDIGAIPSDTTWPAYCIDWEWAARDLRMDYTPVEFDGVTYWTR